MTTRAKTLVQVCSYAAALSIEDHYSLAALEVVIGKIGLTMDDFLNDTDSVTG